jgi:hypothetical protein
MTESAVFYSPRTHRSVGNHKAAYGLAAEYFGNQYKPCRAASQITFEDEDRAIDLGISWLGKVLSTALLRWGARLASARLEA